MLSPKRTKYRKQHKGRIKGTAKGGTELNFGAYGLKATTPGRVSARQIEAARRAMTNHMKRAGRVWVNIFPERFPAEWSAKTESRDVGALFRRRLQPRRHQFQQLPVRHVRLTRPQAAGRAHSAPIRRAR